MMGTHFLLIILSLCAGLALSANCPADSGKWGPTCNFDCNCNKYTECEQTTTSSGCSGDCSDGFKGKPGCQTPCDGFHFGVNCATSCHCLPSITCSRFSGQCSDGKCDPLYYASNCQNRRPQLAAAPNVTLNDCTGLTLTWLQFRWGVDPGSTNVTEYRVYAHYGSTNLLLSTVATKGNSATNELKDVDKLNISEAYTFSLTPVFQYLGANQDGVSTSRTKVVTRLCDKTPPSPAEPSIKKTADFGLNVSWSVKEHTDRLTSVKVMWTKLRYGECVVSTGTTQSATVTLATGFLFLNVSSAWTQYNVTLVGIDAEGLSSTAVEWSEYTAEQLPTVTVANLSAVAAETVAVITWSPPPCQGQGGFVSSYFVEVLQLPDNTKITVPGGSFPPPTTREVKMTGLTSRTTYNVRVRFQTSKGPSQHQQVNFTTNGTEPTTTTTPTPATTTTVKQTTTTAPVATTTTVGATTTTTTIAATTTTPAPSAPTNLRLHSIGEDWARLEWSKPAVAPSGTEYNVTITRTSSKESKVISTTDLFLKVTSLVPYEAYTAKVQAVFGGVGRAESNVLSFTFRGAVGKAGVTGVSGLSDSVTVQWGKPSGDFTPTSYMVIATPRNVSLSPSSTVATSVSKTVPGGILTTNLTGLRAATEYRITVAPVYPGGVSGKASSFLVWTGPGPMNAPLPTPVFKSSGRTSFEVTVKPYNYTGGPLEYYIFVSKTPAARRKRAVTASNFGLPSDARLVSAVTAPAATGTPISVGGTSPLTADTSYRLYYVATSAVGSYRVYKTSFVDVRTAAPASLAWIAAVVILLLILIVLIIILVLLWRRRRTQRRDNLDQSLQLSLHSGEKAPGRLLAPQYFKNWSDTERLNDARFVVLDPEYGPRDLKVDSLRNREQPHDYESFEKEYRSLPNGLEKSCSAGRLPENQAKNRNPSILPYDHCRVTLDRSETSDSSGTDYINASYVDGYLRKRAYIAAQSPFDDDTVADFWLMIYQTNSQQVVMMTEMLEEATVKCTQYWPECGSAEQFGDVHVTCVEEEQFAFYTVRKLQIQLRGRARSNAQPLKQYQFHGWPEHGVPPSPIPLLEMYTRVKMDMRAYMGPLVVHCGTGISRTAVFVALDSLLQQAIHENVVNVYKFCVRLRRSRPNMVRTARQYMFLYDLIFESLLATNQIANLDVRETFRQLSGKNPSTGHSFLWEQHCLLEKYTPVAGPCDAGRLNTSKNRFATILPPDEHRVRLSGPDYINAVFVDGVFAQDEFILTQTPLTNTRADLWRMVVEQRCSVVVDMEAEHRGREGAVDWYPGSGLALSLEPGMTLRAGPVAEPPGLPGVCVREVTVSGGRSPVRIFSLLPGVWSDAYAKVPTDRTALLSLVQAVRAEEGRTGPVTVVCVDGATRSCLFAVCFLAAQKLSCDHYVDVFRTVKSVKLRRPQAVPHLDQYKLIFKLLWDFVRRYMSEEFRTEMAGHGLSGLLPDGDLESVYSHTQCPVLPVEQQGTLGSSGVHYRYANAELV